MQLMLTRTRKAFKISPHFKRLPKLHCSSGETREKIQWRCKCNASVLQEKCKRVAIVDKQPTRGSLHTGAPSETARASQRRCRGAQPASHWHYRASPCITVHHLATPCNILQHFATPCTPRINLAAMRLECQPAPTVHEPALTTPTFPLSKWRMKLGRNGLKSLGGSSAKPRRSAPKRSKTV